MKCNITEQLDDIAIELGADPSTASENILEALEKIKIAVSESEGGSEGEGSASDWDLSDRIAKGTNMYTGDPVVGAVVEGLLDDSLYPDYASNYASAPYSHAEGKTAIISANAEAAHAEGMKTQCSNVASHAEGNDTNASGYASHAEGGSTIASGTNAHAEGGQTIASGNASHAEGGGTQATGLCQHVFGQFNIAENVSSPSDKGTYVEIVGNGTSPMDRSNARTLDWNGNEKIAGSLTLGMGTSGEITITAAQLTALLALLN